MTRKVLECRSLVPDSKCTLLFIGEVDEILGTFRQHVASVHSNDDVERLSKEAARSAQPLVVRGQGRIYVGDQFQQLDSGAIRVSGPLVMLMRINGGGQGIDMQCVCTTNDGGDCLGVVSGPIATCTGSICTSCDWQITLPPGSIATDWMLFE
jgi:hypothetical protein